ncbi:MAG: AMIN domain-containing protein, partial [Proteobacteria bacterium]|nr:AMIN domain-containing protein [Burkholderiales bacterium]
MIDLVAFIERLAKRVGKAAAAAPLLALVCGPLPAPVHAQPGPPLTAQVSAIRVWPAPDSTRITFESPRPITFRVLTLRDPERLVLELDGVDIGSALPKLSAAIPAGDPFIRQARVGRFRPGVVRVVLDLKVPVAPQAFALKPVGEFAHRIVLDLFPIDAGDQVAAFLERQRAAATAPPADRSAP